MKGNRNLFDVWETDQTIKGQLLWIYNHPRLLVSLPLGPLLERFAALEKPRRHLPLTARGLIGTLTHQKFVADLDDASHNHAWIPIVRHAAVLAEISLATTCCDQASVDGASAIRTIFHSSPPCRPTPSILGGALAKGCNVRADRLGAKKKRYDTDYPTDRDYGR
jgi:hypothetical protein